MAIIIPQVFERQVIQVHRTTALNNIDGTPQSIAANVARNTFDPGVFTWVPGDPITVKVAGTYAVRIACSVSKSGANKAFEAAIAIDGTLVDAIGQDEPENFSCVTAQGIFELTAGQTVDMFLTRITGTGNIQYVPDSGQITVDRLAD